MAIKFEVVSFGKLVKLGLEQHITEHYEALNDKAFPLLPDWNRYYKLDELGMLMNVAVLDADTFDLVGYAIFMVTNHLHYSTMLTAMEDLYWITPSKRSGRNGMRLFQFCEAELSKRGVNKIILGTKIKFDHSRLLTALGYKEFEKLFSKTINLGDQ